MAFDVYQAVHGSERTRKLIMNVIHGAFILEISAWTAVSVLLDPAARHNPRRLLRSLWHLRRSPFLNRRALRQLRSYNRQDFHPDERDTSALIAQWRQELFGPVGTLTGRLAC